MKKNNKLESFIDNLNSEITLKNNKLKVPGFLFDIRSIDCVADIRQEKKDDEDFYVIRIHCNGTAVDLWYNKFAIAEFVYNKIIKLWNEYI